MDDPNTPRPAAPGSDRAPRRAEGRGRPQHAGLDHGTKRFVVYVTVLVSSIIALVIILTVAFMPVFRQGYTIPEALQNWGGLIIGFYFGSFVSLLKDWSSESVEIYRDRDE